MTAPHNVRKSAQRELELSCDWISGCVKLFAPGRSAPESRVCNSEHGSTDRPELARQGSPICGVLEFIPRGARRRHHRLRRNRLHCIPSAKPGLERAQSAAQRYHGGNAARRNIIYLSISKPVLETGECQ